MVSKKNILTLVIFLISSCSLQVNNKNDAQNININFEPDKLLNEYKDVVDEDEKVEKEFNDICFSLKDYSLGFSREILTPVNFLENNQEYLAAINGVYWGADDGLPQGITYLDGTDYSTGKGLVSGYLTISNGNIINVTEEQINKKDYKLVIGTHPLLVKDGVLSTQALKERYNLNSDGTDKLSYRSAIGYKTSGEFCFAVSRYSLTMEKWAKTLIKNGYNGALNLDGGPISQLAIRDNGIVNNYGGGFLETRLVIFVVKE